ncbi:hypothetical protein [Spongiimicrobium salis]|uniref:hypothetical protein n=1 Tax=Spongiimicrobium salis TaxID=1667022 RepID=UPI00374D3BE1
MQHPFRPFSFALFLVLSIYTATAQEFNPDYVDYHAEYTPVTPNAANLGTYGATPVDHATGVPQINIPLFTIQEDGVSIPISISYHASGIKVDELASVVGLKWTLNAGGGIFRQVNDKIDEGPRGWLNPNTQGIVDPQWTATRDLSDPLVQQLIEQSNNDEDYYPDDFNYSMPGGSGSFIFDRQGNVRQEFRSTMRVNRFGTGTAMGFSIDDSQGNTFYFDDELEFNTKTVVSGSSISAGDVSINRDTNTAGWMLERVTTKNDREINFTYEPYALNYTLTKQSHSLSLAPGCEPSTADNGNVCGCEGNGSASFLDTNFTETSIIYTPINKLVSTIEAPNTRVTFNYVEDPTLSTWKKKLTSIAIYDKIGNKTRSFVFTYGKFPGDPRLRLDQVQEFGYDGSSKPPYRFFYENGALPQKGDMGKDYYGHYNGKNNTSLIPFSLNAFNLLSDGNRMLLADRTESLEHLKIGVLNKIQYPTGGFSTFNYESNSRPATGGANPTFRPRHVEVSRTLFDSSRTEGDYTIFSKAFSIDATGLGSQGASVFYTTLSDVCAFNNNSPSIDCSSFNIYAGTAPLNGTQIFGSDPVIGAEGSEFLASGDYLLELRVETAKLNTANSNDRIQIDLAWMEEIPVAERTAYMGGLRVASVRDYDHDGVTQIRRMDYGYDNLQGYSLTVANHAKNYGQRTVFSSDNISLNPVLIKSGYFYGTVTIDQVGEDDSVIRTIEKYEETLRNKSYASQMVRQEMYNGNFMVRSMDMVYDNTQDSTLEYYTLGDKTLCYTILREGSPHIEGSTQQSVFLGYSEPLANTYFFRRNVPSVNTEILYFESDSGTFSANVKQNRYTYNDYLQMSSQELDGRFLVTSQANADNGIFQAYPEGEHLKVEYTYPTDHTGLSALNDQYLTGIPVTKKVFDKNRQILGQAMEFDVKGNVTEVYRYAKGQGSNTATASHIPADYELHSSFLVDRGKPVQVQRDQGAFASMLWDQSKNYVLAQLQNVSKAQLDAFILSKNILGITTDGANLNTLSESSLNSFYADLKANFPKAQITSYSYNTMVGVQETTDPSGYSMVYEYDGLSRLERLRDDQNRVEAEYYYHYKGELVTHSDLFVSDISGADIVLSGEGNTFSVQADNGSGNYSYAWTFTAPNGSTVTKTGASVSHSFSTAFIGEVDVRCVVTDNQRDVQGTAARTVSVYRRIPQGSVQSSKNWIEIGTATENFSIAPQYGSGSFDYTWEFITFNNAMPDPVIRGMTSIEKSFGNHFLGGPITVRCTLRDRITAQEVIYSKNVTPYQKLTLGTISPHGEHIEVSPGLVFGITASGGSGNFDFNWTFVHAGATTNVTGASVSPNINGTGTVNITISVQDNVTGRSQTNIRDIQLVQPFFAGTVNLLSTLQSGNVLSVDFAQFPSGGSGNFSYQWNMTRPDGFILAQIDVPAGASETRVNIPLTSAMEGQIQLFCIVTDIGNGASKSSTVAQSTIVPPGGSGGGDSPFSQTQGTASDGSTTINLQPSIQGNTSNTACSWYVDRGDGNGFVETSTDPNLTLLLPCGESATVKCVMTDSSTGLTTEHIEIITQTCN